MRTLGHLHGGSYKRATFYFPKGDEVATETYLQMPDHRRPGEIRDLHFKYCGHKLKKSVEFEKFVEEKVPPKFHERFAKSEKGIVAANSDLLREVDSYDVVDAGALPDIFLPRVENETAAVKETAIAISDEALSQATSDKPLSEKPDAEPSDLEISEVENLESDA